MGMPEFFKSIWILLFVIMILGLLFSVPIEKTKHEYYKELGKFQSEPQRRVDATERFVEAINDGVEDLSKGLKMTPPRKYYVDSEDEEFYKFINGHQDNHAYYTHENNGTKSKLKPRYRRDKNNPKILHPAR